MKVLDNLEKGDSAFTKETKDTVDKLRMERECMKEEILAFQYNKTNNPSDLARFISNSAD